MTTSTSGYDLPNTPIAPNTPNTPNNHSSPKTPKTPTILEEEKQKFRPGSKFQHALRNHGMSEPSTALLHHVGQKFQDVFQIKQGCYADIPPAKISEMMKSNSLDNAPTQSLLSVVNGILDESVERKDGEIPYRVACLLRKVVQEIERRISTQAEHLKTQNNLFKAREEKYKSRISVLEALSTGSSEETQMVKNQLQQMKSEKSTIEKKKAEEQDVERLIKQMDNNHHEIVSLKEELEIAKKNYEQLCLQMDTESKGSHEIESLKGELAIAKKNYEQLRLQTEAKGAHEIVTLKEELEMAKKNNEQLCLKLEEEAKGAGDIVSLKEELEIAKKNNEHLQMEKEAKGAHEIVSLKEELEIAKKNNEELQLKLETEAKGAHENVSLKEELEIAKKNYEQLRVKVETEANHDISSLKQELEMARKNYDQRCSQMEKEAKGTQLELEERLKEVMNQLTDSRNKFKKLEVSFESKSQRWNKKEHVYQIFTESQLAALRELKFSSQTIRQEITQTQKIYVEDSSRLGRQIAVLGKAAESYYEVLAENRKLHNEVQDLKGNIRVYCRIRPFLPTQKGKETMVESVGDSGELIVVNPAKQGKEARRSFKFNKVYGPAATQVHVYSDIRPLIRSVLDGYNVCIFAYGQTGSGKTYTMSGPDGASEEDWGVNYRALNDLFSISQTRQSTYTYEIGVQMIEIYNEQVRDLLSSGGSQKKLGIMSTSQASRLAVPDASMVPVQATSDVLDLMEIGLRNRAKGSTAINERSSRSHSVVTIHSRGTDLKTGSLLHGSLHLVDLAGSERVDRSEVTGDRLKEAQHINKSLSALGDVIFALSQKSSHVPYRNSKLTQVLQSSLGGQAKTLMFVQLNPDTSSFSESLSTLKFAERVSGVELGAAKSSKEGRDVRELMEQVVSLKDTITKKDAEIERLQGVNG